MLDRSQAGMPSTNHGSTPLGSSIAGDANVGAGVDILVNNAGIQHTARTEAFPLQKWNDLLSVNLSAAFHTTRLALPKMQRQLWGRIVNVASIHGKVASVEKSAYCASKFGIIGLSKVKQSRRINMTHSHAHRQREREERKRWEGKGVAHSLTHTCLDRSIGAP